MTDRRLLLLGAALVTVIMLVSSMGLLAGMAGAHAPAASPTIAANHASAPPSTPGGAPSHGSPFALPQAQGAASTNPKVSEAAPDSTLPYGIAQAQHDIATGQVAAKSVLLPRAPNGAIPSTGSPITGPSYPTIPAPMGLADFGQGASGSYEYNTSSFAATLQLNNFTDYNPGYAGWEASPNWMTFQLNTVTVNTSYPGATNGSFWIQNVVHFNGTSLQFEDNIWNFSSPAACLGYGTLLSYSGVQDGCFYYVYGPTYTVTYPFTLTLYNNVTIVNTGTGDVPGVYFNYTITNTTSAPSISGSFDFVTFNGTASSSAPPQFQVNGYNYNPLGYLFYDAEIIFGGNGGGANAMITNLSGSATLDYLPVGSSTYVSIPSAYDYGGDTGETAEGVAATWTGTTETLTQGPSMLYGLWNTQNSTFGPAAPGASIAVTLAGVPNYGFAFVENLSTYLAPVQQNWSYWPGEANGTVSTVLPWMYTFNFYVVQLLANGYNSANYTFDYNSSGTIPPLTANAAEFDTPVYLSTDAQVAAFGASGVSGVTYSSGDLWINDTESSIDPAFSRTNDFLYPTFMLFAALNLTDSVSINNFVQDPTTFNYTSDGRGDFTSLGWTQGYYFNYGTGNFDVTNVSTAGNLTLVTFGAYPLGAVEFWSVNDEVVSNVVNSADTFGVTLFNSDGASVTNVSGLTGANALVIFGGEDDYADGLVANGTFSYALYLDDVGFSTFFDISAVGPLSYGIVGGDAGFLDFEGVSASLGGVAFDLEEAEIFGIYDVSVTTDSQAGYLFGIEDVDIFGVNISYSDGFDIEEVENLDAGNLTASGPQSAVFAPLDDGQDITINGTWATDGAAFSVAVEFVQDVVITNTTASGGSGGLGLLGDANVTVSNVNASGDSFGLILEESLNATVNWVNASSGSLGAGIAYDDWANVTWVNASESALSSNYFTTLSGIGPFATAAAEVIGGGNVTLDDVSALNYNYGVVGNDTWGLFIVDLTEWNGVIGVSLNNSWVPAVVETFLYGNTIGVDANDTQNFTLAVSTIEGSSSYGVWIAGGNWSEVVDNNFVANNGASTDGVFSASNVQAGVALTAGEATTWADNYWSDSTLTTYTIAPGVQDTSAVAVFISNWLQFNETGLPVGTAWGYTLDGVNYETTAPLVFIPSWSLPTGTLQFTVNPPVGYTPTPASGAVTYNPAVDQTQTINFAAIPYTVTFSETGLPAGTGWTATLNGTPMSGTASTIAFTETVGSYAYTVGGAAGYAASPSSGTVTVSGSDVTVNIVFAIVTYSVVFSQSTLPSGTQWSVTLGTTQLMSSSNDITFTEPNGSYIYSVGAVSGYTASPSGGTLSVSGPTALVIAFTAIPPGQYSVTFTETGLTTGTNWSVTLSGTTESSISTTISFLETNGSYTYTIPTVAGNFPSPASGPVSVAGKDVNVAVTFSTTPPATMYSLTFTESGLPSGTPWSVSLNGGTPQTSDGTTIVFTDLQNGSYSFSVGSVSGYTFSVSVTSPVTIAGHDAAVTVTYTSSVTPPPSTSGSSGLSTLDWILIAVVIAIIVIALIVGLVMRGRGGSGKGAAPPSNEPVQPWNEGNPPGGASGGSGTPPTEGGSS